jgi:hypothetical protein
MSSLLVPRLNMSATLSMKFLISCIGRQMIDAFGNYQFVFETFAKSVLSLALTPRLPIGLLLMLQTYSFGHWLYRCPSCLLPADESR